MRILFITELYPEPGKGGEFIRNYGLVKLLESSGHEVYSILGINNEKHSKQADTPNTRYYNFANHYATSQLKDVLLKFKTQPDLIEILEDVTSSFKPDIVLWDYYYYGQYISFFRKKNIPIIFGTHNVQSRLYAQTPSVSFKNSITKRIIYQLLRLHENRYFKNADALIAVSDNDLVYYQKKYPKLKSYMIPNFLLENEYLVDDDTKENYIIMTGNFGAYQNSEGLKWFLTNVWDEELAKKSKFLIAGRNSDTVYNDLTANNGQYPAVEALGSVDDMKPYIAKAKVSIVPLLHGSGTRLKCIESMALKTQLLSTAQGAEGIEHKGSIAIANEPTEFKSKLLQVLDGRINNANTAYEVFIDKYSLKASIAIFNQIVSDLTN